MPDISHQALELGKEALHETAEVAGEQLGIKKKEKGATHGAREQFNFWDEFKTQMFSHKSPEQVQKEAMQAQQGENFKSPEKMAAARRRLQEMNTQAPTQQRPYEYRGPEVPNQNTQQQTQQPQTQGPQIPQNNTQRPTPSSLDFTKQGSNEMMKKMVG